MKVTFLGGNATVTGSKTLLESSGARVLVDCGLFQGLKNLRLKNREPFPFDVATLDAVFLTHAHVDHSGCLPLLTKRGYRGPVYCTQATKDLCSILLPDCGYLQEEEARYAIKHQYSKKHSVPEALYTQVDAFKCLEQFQAVDWRTPYSVGDGSAKLEFQFHPAGHLFGAASIRFSDGQKSILFSGDLGRKEDPITRDPSLSVGADDVVIESTYGNRLHIEEDVQARLREIICRTFERKGVLLIPSFAVGRAQTLLFHIKQLSDKGLIPLQNVYLNSPMASKANALYLKNAELESKLSPDYLRAICHTAKTINSVEESQSLNERKGPMIIIAASGMATGGRVVHHLKAFGGDPKNTILFAGFQAAGTRGDSILRGEESIKIHGEYWPIRAEVLHLDSLSAHADSSGLISWAERITPKPRRFFINHGEPSASDSLRRLLRDRLNVETLVPEPGQSFNLDEPVQVRT